MSSEYPQKATGGVPSIISSDLEIKGDLEGDGEVQIDGTVKGDIKGHMLTIGEHGKIDGSTVAETMHIFGTVNGRVQAKTVHLEKNARVMADITHETITIEAGAYFEGQVRRLSGANSGGAGKLKLRPAY